MEFDSEDDLLNNKTLSRHISQTNLNLTNDKINILQKNSIEGKHGHERYGEDGIVFHKDTIILISSMIIMIIVGKLLAKVTVKG